MGARRRCAEVRACGADPSPEVVLRRPVLPAPWGVESAELRLRIGQPRSRGGRHSLDTGVWASALIAGGQTGVRRHVERASSNDPAAYVERGLRRPGAQRRAAKTTETSMNKSLFHVSKLALAFT